MTAHPQPYVQPVTPWDAPMRVAEAQGRVSVQANCTLGEALDLMRERAAYAGLPLNEIANDINKHRIWFST